MIAFDPASDRAEYMARYQKRYRSMYRNKRINLTVSPEEYALLQKFARKEGLSLPKGTLKLAFLGLGRIPPEECIPEVSERFDRVIFLLRNATNNLNQIAHRLHLRAKQSGRQIVCDPRESNQLLKEIHSNLARMEQVVEHLAAFPSLKQNSTQMEP